MIVFVDAYNVLKLRVGSVFIDESTRKKFIEQLKNYASVKNHDVVVVFDGGDSDWPSEVVKGNVTIIYSGSRASADDVILRLLNKAPPHDTAVVSSDGDICRIAAKHNIVSIDSADFMKFLESPTADRDVRVSISRIVPKKMDETKNSDLDALMEKASRVIMHKDRYDDEENFSPRKSGNKRSKHEKKLLNIVKKL